ncbi:MAG: cyclic nucleotide-binding domain-containing protein [Labilithrix sp.]|nr:cyclic nucleotide-binding domain-containing protein [Labilithrix sp.]
MRPPDLTERLFRLRGVPVFGAMTATELAPLAATMRPVTFEKGEVVSREDEPPRAFYMLLTGAVTMRRRGKVIRTVAAPGGVGFLSLLARTSGGTEAVAQARTETFELPADALYEMYEDHFPALLGTLRWLTERFLEETARDEPRPYVPPSEGFDRLVGERELGLVERIFLLRRTVGFRDANVNSTARLARTLKELRVDAGASIWRPGDRATKTIFPVKGEMDLVWRDADGRRRVQVVGPGYVVGGAEAISNRPRWNELVTTEPSVYLEGSREALIDMLEDDIEVGLQFLSMLAGGLLTTWDRRADADAARSPAG